MNQQLQYDDLHKCCDQYPTVCMPMQWGNRQIDPSLTPHVECGQCSRQAHGETTNECFLNWNAIDGVKSNEQSNR